MVDKNLFLYDLAIVAIFKDEARYLKEWLDYHLLAGVEHFYLYNNDSTDNYREVLAPYVEKNLVTLIDFPGKVMQMPAYNDAIEKFRFECRYMAFIDLDEFIFPKSNRSIVEVIDEILSNNPDAVGLVANWQIFGSNGHDKAEYSRGVLERFTRRASSDRLFWDGAGNKSGTAYVKTIANPRLIRYVCGPHYATYFYEKISVNSNGKTVSGIYNFPVLYDKIVINHYCIKSREEYLTKKNKGRADRNGSLDMEYFFVNDCNETFDDGILKYRAARAEKFSFESNEQRINRVISCLFRTLTKNSPANLETLLTCWAVAEKFQIKIDNSLAEEVALGRLHRALTTNPIEIAEIQMLLKALPEILSRPFPICKEINQLVQNSNLARFIEPDKIS
ncbi:MAG: glycosyltransferase family 92 protein [Selenomonadaceae bacterium]|nr:glycosyltransferase family 92 protein [Selenomonadaceae bacterium]MBQ6131232.1 glycosyltransferase family 92 protein [Selenomonadaceae bacterium]